LKPRLLNYIIALIITFCLLGQKSFAQTAPDISYYTPKSYTRNVAIPALAPINTGGTVPAQTYGDVTTFKTGLNQPCQSVFDAAGNLFVADAGSHTIKKITPSGVVSVFAGTLNTSGNTSTRLNTPDGITIDDSGNFYVSDLGNNSIRKITPVGVITTFATGVTGPASITYSAGNLYVAEQGGHSIVKIVVATATVTTFAGSTAGTSAYTNATGTSARFNQPSDVIVDASGNLKVVDYMNNAIRNVTSTGVVTTFAGGSPNFGASAGTTGTTNANGTAARFNNPYGIGMDGGGNFYIADYLNNEIRKITPAADVTLLAGSTTSGTTDGNTTAARFTNPSNITSDGSGYLYISDYGNDRIRKMSICGYTISPALPSGLIFNTTTGVITGTPNIVTAAANYTITAYNYYGSSSTIVNIAVSNSLMDISDANTAANGITQGTLHPGETDVVLYGFSFNTNSAMTVSGFKLNATYTGGNGAGFYLTNGKLYKNTTANTFAGATLVTSTGVAFNYNQTTPAITITGLSESFTTSASPVYYFIVADIIYSNPTMLAASQTMQFKFATAQSGSVSSNTGNYASNIDVNGTTFTVAPPTVTVSDNNFTTSGITNGSLSYGQTDIVLFSFKVVVDGVYQINTFNSIPCTANVNQYLDYGKLYRSTTQNFSDAQLVTGTVSFPGSNAQILSADEQFNSYTGVDTYYYFLVADLTKVTLGATAIKFSLSTAAVAFTDVSTNKQYKPSTNITGINFPILTTYKWIGQSSTDFNSALNYKTLLNANIAAVPSATSNIYIPATYTRLPIMTANLTVGALTFDGATTPTLALSSRTLTVNTRLVTAQNTTATITGTGTVVLPSTALTSSLDSASVLNVSGAASVTNAGIFIMAPASAINLTGNATVANTGTFTLSSDVDGTATIGQLSGTSAFTGTYIVQRYFTGGNTSNRGWRLMSSPVNNSATPSPTYNFLSLQTNLPITGNGTGFDTAPTYTANGTTILFYNTAGGSFSYPASPSDTRPIGSGFYFYFRGNKTNILNKLVRSGSPAVFATPEANVVGLQTGTLNQNNITYTLSNAGKGYNLVGNPYPSTITLPSGVGANTVCPGTTGFIYTYISGANSLSPQPGPTIDIASGQGFFVKSNNTTSSINFTESLKTSAQVTGSNLLLGKPIGTQEPIIALKMIQDSANYDVAYVRFLDSYKTTYDEMEDADDLNASGQAVFLGTMTSDNHQVAVASQPLGKQKTSIFLSVNDNTSGLYTIKKMDLSGIPAVYDVWLMDHFKKDSLNIRANDTYKFNLDRSNPQTYGNSRFEIVIRKKSLPPYQLISFKGARSGADVLLNWSTLNEYDYTSFELQKSTDGVTFDAVKNMQSSSQGSYAFKDIYTNNSTANIYYRLKQVDSNDQITYSNVIIVTTTGNGTFNIFPNPATNAIQFKLDQPIKSQVRLNIFNTMGILMKSNNFSSSTGQQDVTSLTPGSYTVELTDLGSKKIILTGKFIKI
jgi:sugar lactone lactonase YvrE